MTAPRPWETGSPEDRWNGYFTEPGSQVLRNLLDIEDRLVLAGAENDFVEFRIAQLREQPELVPRTFDLPHFQALHAHLFQDVYEWAGDLRTVGLAKDGGESFIPPGDIWRPVDHVVQRIRETENLRALSGDRIAHEVAYLYDYLNFAHPFREGNGRAQREFFAQLLAESKRGLDWQLIEMSHLHHACHVARNSEDLGPLTAVIRTVLVDEAQG